MARKGQPELLLAGFGTSSPLQISLEAHQAAVRSGSVLALGLPGRLREALRRQDVEIAELDHLFDERPFADAYAAVAQTVLSRAEQDPPAVFLTQGNPLLLNAINRYLFAEAGKRGIAVRVYPAVSPIDVVVSELGLDVGRVGLLTISARGLVARPAALNPQVPLLVLQVAGLVGQGESSEAYGRLVEVLGRAYPDTQAVTLCNMPGDGGMSRATATLGRFGELVPHIDTSSCLFIDIRRNVGSA